MGNGVFQSRQFSRHSVCHSLNSFALVISDILHRMTNTQELFICIFSPRINFFLIFCLFLFDFGIEILLDLNDGFLQIPVNLFFCFFNMLDLLLEFVNSFFELNISLIVGRCMLPQFDGKLIKLSLYICLPEHFFPVNSLLKVLPFFIQLARGRVHAFKSRFRKI